MLLAKNCGRTETRGHTTRSLGEHQGNRKVMKLLKGPKKWTASLSDNEKQLTNKGNLHPE